MKIPYKNRAAFICGVIVLFLSIGLSFALFYVYVPEPFAVSVDDITEISYKEFAEKLESEKVEIVYHSGGNDFLFLEDIADNFYKVANPDHEDLRKTLLESGVLLRNVGEFETREMIESSRRGTAVLIIMIAISLNLVIIYQAFSTPKKKTVIVNKRKIYVGNVKEYTTQEPVEKPKNSTGKTFNDIAGLKEVKKDVACLVDFLNNKEKYTEAGAKLPRGVIFYGPPGTGKTLLAKAIAGEAGVPFLYMSGSEFVEMYVGVGAKRVRELFEKARRQAPCIVFIDEIDSVGGTRRDNENSEDRKTINALLTEMDGFKESENIIVIGATNRIEDLDPALTRPGRFTNKYCVPLPETVDERREVIGLYADNKRFNESVDFIQLAKETVGFSPAKIEALLNEAAIISVQENRPYITKDIIDKAMYKTLLQGHMKEGPLDRSKEETTVVAWHEAGHAVVGHLFGKDVTKVTVVPSTSGAGGVTFSTPKDISLYSVEDIEQEVMELYGGRMAELLLFEGDRSKVTTGASNDIERATQLIRDAIVKYGMSDAFGMLNLSKAHVSDKAIVESQIDMAKRLEEATLAVLTDNYDRLRELADMLLERTTIYNTDIKAVFERKRVHILEG